MCKPRRGSCKVLPRRVKRLRMPWNTLTRRPPTFAHACNACTRPCNVLQGDVQALRRLDQHGTQVSPTLTARHVRRTQDRSTRYATVRKPRRRSCKVLPPCVTPYTSLCNACTARCKPRRRLCNVLHKGRTTAPRAGNTLAPEANTLPPRVTTLPRLHHTLARRVTTLAQLRTILYCCTYTLPPQDNTTGQHAAALAPLHTTLPRVLTTLCHGRMAAWARVNTLLPRDTTLWRGANTLARRCATLG